MKSIITLAATLTLAITLTLTACEEKKKQDGTTTTATEPAAEAATQEAVAEKPAENAGGGSFTDERDNKTYKTVKIGEQVWMAENLNYETVERNNCYDDEEVNCQKYGLLYEWETAMKACPKGWHLPSNAEWDKLLHYVDGTSGTESPYNSETAGKYLKAKSGWNNSNGTDNYGFSALPGGSTYDGGNMFANDVGEFGYWWSSSKYDSDGAYYLSMNDRNEKVIYSSNKYELYSVRCIQN